MRGLLRTTVYLPEVDYRRIQDIARAEGRPAADLVREAVADYGRRRARRKLPTSLGAGRSGRRDVAERAEKLLGGLGRER